MDDFSHIPPDPFGQLIGYEVTGFDADAGEARVALSIKAEHLSPSGKVHGGVLASLFDFACGAAVLAMLGRDGRCSTVEIKVNFFRPAQLGDHLEAAAKVVFRGKSLCAVTATLGRKSDGEQVAMATGTFNIVRLDKGPDGVANPGGAEKVGA